MILNFATKPNTYGRREYLIMDTDRKTFTRSTDKMLAPSDLFEMKQTDIHKVRMLAEKSGFSAME